MSLPTVCIVGSPNVGKSTVFNRMVGKKTAIVHDEAGVTRDRLYGKCEWLTRVFNVVDTGGIEIKNAPFQKEIRAQVEIAIEEADVIVYVADGIAGVTSDDRMVAKMLYKSNKPIILAVNKIDEVEKMYLLNDFYSLGIKEVIAISSSHGIGIGDLLDKIVSYLPQEKEEDYDDAIPFCVIGRPNVGKSSLVNAIIGQDRVIVSNIEGTTRDAIDTAFIRDDKKYVVIDTAGLKRRGKIFESVDKYAALRAMSAIERSEVVLLVIDGSVGITAQDKHVAGYALESHKAMIIVVNKWDLVEHSQTAMSDFSKQIRQEFKFMDFAPIVFISAKNKSRINTIFPEIDVAYNSYHLRVATSVLNDIIQDAQIMNPTPEFNGGRLKIYYASQAQAEPPTFVLFVNNPEFMHFSYERYLENRMRASFEFEGTPIRFISRERKD